MVFCNVLSHEPNSVVFYVMLNFSGTVPFYKNVFFLPRLNILIFLPMLGWKYSNGLHNFCHWILNIHILPSTSQQAETETSIHLCPLAYTWAVHKIYPISNDLKGLELSADIYDSWSLTDVFTLDYCIYCLGISMGMANLKNELCFANPANAQDIKVYICIKQASGLNQPLACWGEQSHLYSVKNSVIVRMNSFIS